MLHIHPQEFELWLRRLQAGHVQAHLIPTWILAPKYLDRPAKATITAKNSSYFVSEYLTAFLQLLTGMCDGETVGGLQVVDVIIEVEGFLCHILIGVIQLDGEPEGAVLLHRGAHEQPTCSRRKSQMTALSLARSRHAWTMPFSFSWQRQKPTYLQGEWRECI